uniref:Uncharacterized protein n=1 Tax=Poecilia reticulata TaxID=8081 RepID=A0A3P9P8U4_POERE
MASRKESSSASSTPMASTGGTLDSPVKQIQIEGLVRTRVAPFGPYADCWCCTAT